MHPRSTMHKNEDSIVRQETDIASVRTDDVTHGSSYAGNKNVVRREKKNTIETQWALVNDWTSGNERKKEREKWSALLSGVATIGSGGVPVAAMQSHSRSLA